MIAAEEKYHAILLETFKKMITFFEQFNIKWWAAYGTLIGAVRHKGLIPWDDDVDIWVPRKDYDRLLTLSDVLSSYGLILHSPELNEGYYLGMAKICDGASTIWEHRILPYTFGVFVDIFPIDCTDCTREDVLIAQKKYQASLDRQMGVLADYKIVDYLSALRHGAFGVLFDRLRSRQTLKSMRDEFVLSTRSICYSSSGSKMATLYGIPNKPDFFRREWFSETMYVPFDSFEVPIPVGYHDILTYLYGDYMTPPPIIERESTHEKYYLNLKEYLPVEEVKKRLRAGEKIVF